MHKRAILGFLAVGILLATATSAEVATRSIEYKQGETTLTGFFAWDDAVADKRPGVLIVHEWWGHTEHVRNQARRLAEAGYVGFALDMFGDGKVTTHPEEAEAFVQEATGDPAVVGARFEAALEQLKGDPHVDPERIAAIGYCFGGAIVLAMLGEADLDAAVTFHGALGHTGPMEPGSIATRVLVLTGAADPLVPSEQVDAYEQQLRDAAVDFEIVRYPGAKHGFTNRRAGEYGMEALAYDSDADKKSWQAMLDLFAEVFPDAPTAQGIPLEGARAIFSQAQKLCTADGGRLWGRSLCGPIMLVDPQTRQLVASDADGGGVLQERDGVYTGVLPADENIANTAFEWSGTRWTQIRWPLPEGDAERAVLIAHELFHRVQPELAIANVTGGGNPHLDTLEGRYTLQLEWRALARALEADDASFAREAVRDAIAFRLQRYRQFPDAERDETALELMEGLAEYTGVVVGRASPDARKHAALQDLIARASDSSFVRSFALASGPAYGLLLDEFVPGWRERLGEGTNLALLLRDSARIEIPTGEEFLAAAAARHDGAALRATETQREEERQARLERDRRRFVAGPVLTLKFENMKVQFTPTNLLPLDEVGTVYPNLRIVDDWGTLEVEDGALITSDWSTVRVVAPADSSGNSLRGEGWTLELEPGWALAAGPREGDLIVNRTAP